MDKNKSPNGRPDSTTRRYVFWAHGKNNKLERIVQPWASDVPELFAAKSGKPGSQSNAVECVQARQEKVFPERPLKGEPNLPVEEVGGKPSQEVTNSPGIRETAGFGSNAKVTSKLESPSDRDNIDPGSNAKATSKLESPSDRNNVDPGSNAKATNKLESPSDRDNVDPGSNAKATSKLESLGDRDNVESLVMNKLESPEYRDTRDPGSKSKLESLGDRNSVDPELNSQVTNKLESPGYSDNFDPGSKSSVTTKLEAPGDRDNAVTCDPGSRATNEQQVWQGRPASKTGDALAAEELSEGAKTTSETYVSRTITEGDKEQESSFRDTTKPVQEYSPSVANGEEKKSYSTSKEAVRTAIAAAVGNLAANKTGPTTIYAGIRPVERPNLVQNQAATGPQVAELQRVKEHKKGDPECEYGCEYCTPDLYNVPPIGRRFAHKEGDYDDDTTDEDAEAAKRQSHTGGTPTGTETACINEEGGNSPGVMTELAGSPMYGNEMTTTNFGSPLYSPNMQGGYAAGQDFLVGSPTLPNAADSQWGAFSPENTEFMPDGSPVNATAAYTSGVPIQEGSPMHIQGGQPVPGAPFQEGHPSSGYPQAGFHMQGAGPIQGGEQGQAGSFMQGGPIQSEQAVQGAPYQVAWIQGQGAPQTGFHMQGGQAGFSMQGGQGGQAGFPMQGDQGFPMQGRQGGQAGFPMQGGQGGQAGFPMQGGQAGFQQTGSGRVGSPIQEGGTSSFVQGEKDASSMQIYMEQTASSPQPNTDTLAGSVDNSLVPAENSVLQATTTNTPMLVHTAIGMSAEGSNKIKFQFQSRAQVVNKPVEGGGVQPLPVTHVDQTVTEGENVRTFTEMSFVASTPDVVGSGPLSILPVDAKNGSEDQGMKGASSAPL